MGIYTEFLGTLLFLSLFASAALAIALILYRKRIREKDFFLKKSANPITIHLLSF